MQKLQELENLLDKVYRSGEAAVSDEAYDAVVRALNMNNLSNAKTAGLTEIAAAAYSAPRVVPMLSIQNVFTASELRSKFDFDTYVTLEPKLDGIALEITYVHGLAVKVTTRGDGSVGEDVSGIFHSLPYMPKMAVCSLGTPYQGVVRGEAVCSKHDLKSWNENSTKTYKTPRNFVAATFNTKDPKEVAGRPISFVAYSVLNSEGTQSYNFPANMQKATDFSDGSVLSAVTDKVLHERLEFLNTCLPYPVDGIVVKVDDLDLRAELGDAEGWPNWCYAFKIRGKGEVTVLNKIEWQVGRTGAITPVGTLDPVDVGGVTVSKVNLNNLEWMAEKGVYEGAVVYIRRAGEVIPELAEVIDPKFDEQTLEDLTVCPSCGSGVIENSCSQPQSCPEARARQFEYFLSDAGMEVTGYGATAASSLSEKYGSPLLMFIDKVRLGEPSFVKSAKEKELADLITACGIPKVGKVKARTLAGVFHVIEQADLADLLGPVAADKAAEWLSVNKHLLSEAADLLKSSTLPVSNKLQGMAIAVTGSFASYSRKEVEKIITSNGGKVSSSVSKKTSMLVAGSEAGSKLEDAKEKGVPVITVTELVELVS